MLEFAKTVLHLCSMLSNALIEWSGTVISVRTDASVISERDIRAVYRCRKKFSISSKKRFFSTTKKSTRKCNQELQIPQSKIGHKHSRFIPYKVQLIPKTQDDKKLFEFRSNLLTLMKNDSNLLSEIIFSKTATFH